ncbi:MAG: undecaprenyldiphospho-muramoylpentapeptide beta-N-acetylglucosaminyltransferase [Firmicutes bacterium]|nr:undecaprenyldiphospho-muramoylpentapeptide beta-N-acetylglucosaminyltransferase [Bacillota bacterium]
MKAIVSGGGTGGHIYPALAIAGALKKSGCEVLFMGGQKSPDGQGAAPEEKAAQNAGFAYQAVPASGLHLRRLTLGKEIFTNLQGWRQAKTHIKKFKPDIVIGCGGYAAAPVLRAAQSLGIPTLLHEQNAYPGRANRYLAKRAKGICQTFAASASFFPAQTPMFLTGLPVRQAVLHTGRQQAWDFFGIDGAERDIPTVLITGGSQGAQSINKAALDAYARLLDADVRIVHLCGKKNYPQLRQAAPQHPRLLLYPYLEQMEYALALADLAVARAGASFIAEIACLGLPSLLIPFPYAAGDHQTANAQAMAAAGAAEMIGDAGLNGDLLAEKALAFIHDPAKRQKMSEAAKSLAKPQAAEHICQIAKDIIEENSARR